MSNTQAASILKFGWGRYFSRSVISFLKEFENARFPVLSCKATEHDGAGSESTLGKVMSCRFIETIAAHARGLPEEAGGGEISPRVLEAMARVPREAFVPADYQGDAHRDSALPIGYGQTISQPFIVAYMTHLLDVDKGDQVLEIGTGSGYQAAVLAELGVSVFSVETIPELATEAKARLQSLGYGGVQLRTGDGYEGWPEHAPYRGILVTAAADRIPRALLDQLEPGGRMVLPVARAGGEEWLILVEKDAEDHVSQRELIPVRFVPLRHD